MSSLAEALSGRPIVSSEGSATQPIDVEEERQVEYNIAIGPGSIAGSNALVMRMTDNSASPEQMDQIHQLLKRRREFLDTQPARKGSQINYASGPGAVAGRNVTVIDFTSTYTLPSSNRS